MPLPYMIAEQEWCNEVAELLQIPEKDGLRAVLALADGDRVRAWRFALTMRKIGFCPVSMARKILGAAGIQQGAANQL